MTSRTIQLDFKPARRNVRQSVFRTVYVHTKFERSSRDSRAAFPNRLCDSCLTGRSRASPPGPNAASGRRCWLRQLGVRARSRKSWMPKGHRVLETFSGDGPPVPLPLRGGCGYRLVAESNPMGTRRFSRKAQGRGGRPFIGRNSSGPDVPVATWQGRC